MRPLHYQRCILPIVIATLFIITPTTSSFSLIPFTSPPSPPTTSFNPFNPSLHTPSKLVLRGGFSTATSATTTPFSTTSTPTPTQAKPNPTLSFISKNFFVLGMLTALTASYISPSLFSNTSPLNPSYYLTSFGVPVIFLLSSLSLAPGELLNAFGDIKLNALILIITYVLYPLIVYILSKTIFPIFLPRSLINGILVLSTLPTTVNMCIALSATAGGNVSVAVTSAVISNVFGVVVTPLLLSFMFVTGDKKSSLSLITSIIQLSKKVLLPMLYGQILRFTPLKRIQQTYSNSNKRIQEGILLLIVFNSFCNAFTPSSTSSVISFNQIATLFAVLPMLHIFFFLSTLYVLPLLLPQTPPETTISASFASSHKTLAFGLPLIQTIFKDVVSEREMVGLVTPLLVLHPMQLFVGGVLVGWGRDYIKRREFSSKISKTINLT